MPPGAERPARRWPVGEGCSRARARPELAVPVVLPDPTSSRDKVAAASMTTSFNARSASYGLLGGSGRSAGKIRHCTACPTRIGTRPRPALLATTAWPCSTCGDVERRGPSKRGEGSGYRQSEEPSVTFRDQ